jgi:RNA polymerase sigma-70 factor (ECF subfamily)
VTSDEQQALAGGRDRLARLYHELKDGLLTVAVELTGERGAGEDLLHDVFVAFARRNRPPRDAAEARRYLVASLWNRARDLKRRRAAPEPDGEALARAVAQDGGPLRALAANEEAARIAAQLLCLPAEQREVVTLHLHGGLAFREIAGLSGVSINTVTARYRYALLALRRALAPKGVSE